MRKKTDQRVLSRKSRQRRVRKSVTGTDTRPRLSVYRSLRFTYAQLVSDTSGKVFAATSTRKFVADEKSTSSVDSAKVLGQEIAKLAKENNIEEVVFDRNGYLYHGRVKAVAEGAREGGLQF